MDQLSSASVAETGSWLPNVVGINSILRIVHSGKDDSLAKDGTSEAYCPLIVDSCFPTKNGAQVTVRYAESGLPSFVQPERILSQYIHTV